MREETKKFSDRVFDTTVWSEVPDLRMKFLRLLYIQHSIEPSDLEKVIERSGSGEGTVTQILTKSGLLSEPKVVDCLEQASGYPAVDPRLQTPSAEALAKFDLGMAIENRSVPLRIQGDRLLLVMEDPVQHDRKEALQQRLKLQIEPYVFHTDGIFEAITRFYPVADPAELSRLGREGGSLRFEQQQEIEVSREETDVGLLFKPLSEVLFSTVSEVLFQPLFTQRRTVREKVKVRSDTTGADKIDTYTSNPESATAVTDQILRQALAVRATDVHVEPFQDAIRIRVRRDTSLTTLNYLALEMHAAVINRIKVLARLDVAERRKIQESSFRYTIKPGDEVNFRVSILPTARGESAELRVIDGRQGRMGLPELGMNAADRERFMKNLQYPNGLILITGPTASGKTTTLYSALKKLNVEGRKILTAEDPIEFEIYGISQVEVNPKTGLSYAQALKAFLRQDPDVLMLGEIRDAEVASVAISAALTGHLVLAGLHTNDAASTSSRLLSTLGCDPLLVSDSLLMVVGQRLVRLLCPACVVRQPIEPADREAFGRSLEGVDTDFAAPGCPHCRQTGIAGLTAAFEVMDVSPRIKQLIFERAPTSKIFDTAKSEGMRPMVENALDLVRAGRTSLAEVRRDLVYKRLF